MAFCPLCGAAAPLAHQGPVEVPTCVEHGPAWRLVRTGMAAEVVLFSAEAVLLCRRATEPFAGYWSPPGGFLDPGELPAEAARREAKEETGVEAELEGLVGLYGNWYARGDWVVAAVFLGSYSGEPRSDETEVSEVGLFSPDELPAELAWDHRQKIEDALAYREGRR